MDYTHKNKEEILNWLKENLDEERFLHSLGTAECAKHLAEKFNQNNQKAYLAGLLHDCAKCLNKDESIKIAQEMNLAQEEINNAKILHAPVSAFLAQRIFGIEDEQILSSIRWHTLGKLEMTDFEKIIFLADKIEPKTRNKECNKKIIQLLEEENGFDKALFTCYKETIKSLVERELKICNLTIDIYNELVQKI